MEIGPTAPLLFSILLFPLLTLFSPSLAYFSVISAVSGQLSRGETGLVPQSNEAQNTPTGLFVPY